MAFVFRSSKDVDKIPKKEEGNEYFNIKDKLDLLREKRDSSIINNNTFSNSSYMGNNSVKSKAPFGTLALKTTLQNYKGPTSPGPGTYDFNESLIKKQFNKNNTSPDMIENEEENKKRLFISQQERFRRSKYEVNVPGPGKYNIRDFEENKKLNDFHNSLTKKSFLYKTDYNTYEPFSPSRILSIPSKGINYGYEISKNGNVKIAKDPQKNKKYSGTKNNSVGPGQYNDNYTQKNAKIGIIDWNRSMNKSVNRKKEREKEMKKNNQLSQFNGSQYDSNYFFSNISTEPTINNSLSIINFNKKNKTKNYFYTDIGFDRKNIEVKFSNAKIIKNDNFSRTINRSNLSPFFKLDTQPEIDIRIRDDTSPGPGAYLSLNNFNYVPKDEKHQFFGSSNSRGIMYPNLTNNIRIGKNTMESILDLDILSKKKLNKSKSFNTSENIRNNFKLKKDGKKNDIKKNQKIIDKADLIKEISKNIKKDIESNLGPGSYNPEKGIKSYYSYEVGNFGTLERRFPLYPSHEEFPGAGSYIHLDTWGPKKKNNSLERIVPSNVTSKLKEGISANKMGLFRDKIMKEYRKQPSIGQYAIENINTINYNTKKSVSVSKNQPGFGSSFKRFYIFKNQLNEKNGVGSYNIDYPEIKKYQQNAAFLATAGRSDIDNNKKKNIINPIAGPGSYRKDSYFDWNKKSYNILFN